MVVPVMYEDIAEARKRTASATSSGLPTLPIAFAASMRAWKSATRWRSIELVSRASIGVSIVPGATATFPGNWEVVSATPADGPGPWNGHGHANDNSALGPVLCP